MILDLFICLSILILLSFIFKSSTCSSNFNISIIISNQLLSNKSILNKLNDHIFKILKISLQGFKLELDF